MGCLETAVLEFTKVKVIFVKQVLLNRTKLKVSEICLGGASFGAKLMEEESLEVLDRFYEAGGNFIDTAKVYCDWIPGMEDSSERTIGRWLRERGLIGKVVVATKGGHYDLAHPEISRVNEQEVRKDLEKSQMLLGLDIIDLYWLHRDDETKPVDEIIDFMEKLVKEGRIRYYGASNYSLERLEQARKYAKKMGFQGFTAVSNQWSLAGKTNDAIAKEDSTLVTADKAQINWHEEHQIPLIPYTAIAGGFFEKLNRAGNTYQGQAVNQNGTFELYWNSRNLMIYNDMLKLYKEMGYSFMEMSVAYLLQQKFPVFPVCGVGKKEQLDELIKAASIKLPMEIMEKWNGLLTE